MKLNSKQRKNLRSQAHHLEPVILIGKNGINEGAMHAIEQAISIHELIKVKFREYKDEKKKLSNEIAEILKAEIIGLIGNTVILYKFNPDLECQLESKHMAD